MFHAIIVIHLSIFTIQHVKNFVPMTKSLISLYLQSVQPFTHIFNYSLNHDYRNSCPPSSRFMPSERCFFMH